MTVGGAVRMSVYVRSVSMVVTMNMTVAFLSGASEQITYFIRCEIGDDLCAGMEFVGDSRNGVSEHHAFHDFLVNG